MQTKRCDNDKNIKILAEILSKSLTGQLKTKLARWDNFLRGAKDLEQMKHTSTPIHHHHGGYTIDGQGMAASPYANRHKQIDYSRVSHVCTKRGVRGYLPA